MEASTFVQTGHHAALTPALLRTCAYAGSNEQRHPWKQLSPGGVGISEGGWLEHHVREMCGALRPEASRSSTAMCSLSYWKQSLV